MIVHVVSISVVDKIELTLSALWTLYNLLFQNEAQVAKAMIRRF